MHEVGPDRLLKLYGPCAVFHPIESSLRHDDPYRSPPFASTPIAAIRGWPMQRACLSGIRRVSSYGFFTASLKAADTLASACPAETALTPAGRMGIMRKRLAAVRDATAAIPRAVAILPGRWIRGRR